MSLVKKVQEGNRRASLVALRDIIASRIELAAPRDTAALAKQLTEVLLAIEGIKDDAKEDKADELARRRASRRSGSNA